MTNVLEHVGFSQEAFDDFLSGRDEPGWLTDQRRAAWQTFQARQLPSRSEEEWMRTDIRLFKLDRYGIPGVEPSREELPPAQLSEGVELGGQVVSLNGCGVESRLADKWRQRGVVFGNLAELAAEHGDLIRPHLLTKAVDPHYDKFAALHASCWTSGAFLYVPRGVEVDEPLHAFSALTNGATDLGHLLVVLEDGAQATLLTETGSPSETDGGLHCGAIELIVGAGARLQFVNLQDWGHGVWHFAHQKGLVDRDGSLQWTIGALGARLAKVNQHVALVGPGASTEVNGTMFTQDKQHLSYHTLQHHCAPHTRSDLLYKTALQDKSRTVWRGMIKVDEKAVRTDGYQRNDNLLLSHTARADSIPGLEIECDDVRCTHGSTSGHVDDELVFYAQSRGFTRREAIRMIVSGFFQQIFDRIRIESVREALGRAIARRVREYD